MDCTAKLAKPEASSRQRKASRRPRQPRKGKGAPRGSPLHLRAHEQAPGETPSAFSEAALLPDLSYLTQQVSHNLLSQTRRGHSAWSPGCACQTQLDSAWPRACKDATPKGGSVGQEKTQLCLRLASTSACKTYSPALTNIFSLFI